MDLTHLRRQEIEELVDAAEMMGLENPSTYKQQDLIRFILNKQSEGGDKIFGSGVLEIQSEGFGFLRVDDGAYMPASDDIYVSPAQIKRFSLRTGDTVSGQIRPPKEDEKYFALVKVDTLNGDQAEVGNKAKMLFENLLPFHATSIMPLERGDGTKVDLTGRIVDLMCPIGKGQRGLIVAPPKAGKTMLLQNIATAITKNHKDVHLIVLLIDERPEEVTEMKMMVDADVVASTFDEPAARHIQVAEMVIEKAKRLVEHKKDVVILLDSITRLARAYNTVAPSSGKVLTGGIDSNGLHKPKRFFGAARNIERGGSLTIVATALVDTGSKMDEVIYEEFKGTGNMEMHLSRKLSEKRIFPAIDVKRSSTRREELLLDETALTNSHILRRLLVTMRDDDATEFLIDNMGKSKTNKELFNAMKKAKGG